MEKLGVAISARLPAATDGEENSERSASGFLLDARQGHVITTASWFRNILKLHATSSQGGGIATTSWNLHPAVQFHVLLAESRDCTSEWQEARVVAVHCVSRAFEALAAFFGGRRGSLVISRDQEPGSALQQEDITGLLYLSSVVLLKVTRPEARLRSR